MQSVIDIAGNRKAVNTNVQQYRANNTEAQRWRIVFNSDGSVSFIAKNSGLALDVKGANFANSTNVQMYKVNYTKAQNFVLTGVQAP